MCTAVEGDLQEHSPVHRWEDSLGPCVVEPVIIRLGGQWVRLGPIVSRRLVLFAKPVRIDSAVLIAEPAASTRSASAAHGGPLPKATTAKGAKRSHWY